MTPTSGGPVGIPSGASVTFDHDLQYRALEKVEVSLLSGTMNWNAPGDVIGATEAIEIRNFKPNADGALLTRQGRSGAVYSGGDTINVIKRVVAASPGRYAGTTTGHLIDAIGGSTLASGFGPGPMFMSYWLGYLWAATQAKQLKYKLGTGPVNWAVPAPPAPTAGGAWPSGGAQVATGLWGGSLPDATYTYWVTYVTGDNEESNPVSVQFSVLETTIAASIATGAQTVAPADMTGIAVSQSLIITDPGGGAQETVVVTAITSSSFSAVFANPHAGPGITVDSGGWVAIASPPASTDPQVTGWNVYRSGNTLNTAYLMNADPLGFGGVYGDSGGAAGQQDDDALLRFGIQLEVAHDPPPAASGVAGPYMGKLLMWNSAAHPNRLWWSITDKPYAFPGSAANSADGNWVDCGDDGDAIVNVTIRPRFVLIYKQNEVYRLAGDPDDLQSDIERVAVGFGLGAPLAITSLTTHDALLGPDGIYSFNGDSLPQKLSRGLDPFFAGLWPDSTTGIALPPLADGSTNCCMAHRHGRLYFSCSTGTGTNPPPNCMLVLDIASGRWMFDSRGFTALHDEGQAGVLLGAGTNIYALEQGWQDDTANFPIVYQSRYQNFGVRENQKMCCDLVIEANTGGAALTPKMFYDSGAVIDATLAAFSSTVRQLFVFPLGPATGDKIGWAARNAAVRIEGTVNNNPVTIYGITLHYYLLPRDALTYDSGITDLNDPHHKLIDLIELEIDAPDGASVQLYSDFPGGSVIPRFVAGVPVAATSGRTNVQIQCEPYVEGRLVRVVVVSTGAKTFQLWKIRVRIRSVGEVFNGANSELFKSLEVCPAIQ